MVAHPCLGQLRPCCWRRLRAQARTELQWDSKARTPNKRQRQRQRAKARHFTQGGGGGRWRLHQQGGKGHGFNARWERQHTAAAPREGRCLQLPQARRWMLLFLMGAQTEGHSWQQWMNLCLYTFDEVRIGLL